MKACHNIGTHCHLIINLLLLKNIFFLLIAVLSVQCKVWILPNGRDQSFATKLPSATGRFEICARKTRWISVSHICAEFSPLLSSTPALCDQQPSSAPSSWDKMIQLMFAISIGRKKPRVAQVVIAKSAGLPDYHAHKKYLILPRQIPHKVNPIS